VAVCADPACDRTRAFQIGFLARITRSAMLDVLDQDFIRTARAKGVDEWKTISKHAFRNTLIPVVTVSGIILSLLIGGSVVRRAGFCAAGIGRLIVQGILAATTRSCRERC